MEELKAFEADLTTQQSSIEESKSKLFKHWSQYVEKNEKLKTLERSLATEKKLLDERER
jgi:hypothetical protein